MVSIVKYARGEDIILIIKADPIRIVYYAEKALLAVQPYNVSIIILGTE